MKTLKKEEFLGADDLPLSPVSLPESYGKDVGFYVRMMTGTERSAMEKRIFAGTNPKDDPEGFRIRMLADCIVDENGKHIFEKADAKRLMSKAAPSIELMFEAACELNGFTADDVEQLEKN